MKLNVIVSPDDVVRGKVHLKGFIVSGSAICSVKSEHLGTVFPDGSSNMPVIW